MKHIFCLAALLLLVHLNSEEKKIVVFTGSSFATSRIFEDASLNWDNFGTRFPLLRRAMEKHGYQVEHYPLAREDWTLSELKALSKDAESVIFFDVPLHNFHLVRQIKDKNVIDYEKLYLVTFEPPLIDPYNYDLAYTRCFHKIFTFVDDLVEEKRIFRYFDCAPRQPFVRDLPSFWDKKLLTMVIGFHNSINPSSLYPKRREIIDYFEEIESEDFEFYGGGWDPQLYKNYRGTIPRKIEVLKHYRFSICYENSKVNGYITGDKIFYSLLAGCVPIYWGYKGVERYIPENCFIDGSKFSSPEELYDHLKSISEEEYNAYIENIKAFCQSDQALLFSDEHFVDTLLRQILPNYDPTLAFSAESYAKLERIWNYKQNVLFAMPPAASSEEVRWGTHKW